MFASFIQFQPSDGKLYLVIGDVSEGPPGQWILKVSFWRQEMWISRWKEHFIEYLAFAVVGVG